MRVRDIRLCAFAVVALFFAAPANAVTVPLTPNNIGPVALVAGNDYQGSNFLLPAGEDVFTFSLPTAPLGSISATVSFTGKGIFEIAWFKGPTFGTSTPETPFIPATETTPLLLTLLDAGTPYFLAVRNIGEAGVYGLSVTTTPLPPALILFGTALAGLTWLGRRRRQTVH